MAQFLELQTHNKISILLIIFFFNTCNIVDICENKYGVFINDFTNFVIVNFNYGNKKNEIGYIKDVKKEKYKIDYPLYSKIKILNDKTNNLYIFDYYNENIKILNNNKIKEVIYIKNFYYIYKKNKQDYSEYKINSDDNINPKFNYYYDKIYLNNNYNKEYNIYIDINDGIIKKDSTKEYKYIGSNNIITSDYNDYNNIDKFIKSFIFINIYKYLSYSFCIDRDDKIIFAFLTYDGLSLYKYNPSSKFFSFISRTELKISKKELDKHVNEIKIFSDDNNYFIFIYYGIKLKSNKQKIYNVTKKGEMIILSKSNLKKIYKFNLEDFEWDYFTVINGYIYTWDYLFITSKFNLYILKYNGSNPDLKDILK